MITLGEKSLLSPQKCVQLIQQEDEKKILKKLMNSKKLPFSQRFRDPIISEVYVECEYDTNINRRVKTEKEIGKNSARIRSLVKNEKTPKNRHLYSQSVELPNLLKSKPKKRHTHLGHHSEFSSKKGFDSNHSTIFEPKTSTCSESKEKLIEIVEKVYKDSQRSYREEKESKSSERPNNNNFTAKKIKLERLRKPETPGYNARKQWQEISCLKMDTYFVKLMQNKIKIENKTEKSEILFEIKESIILEKIFVPKREDVPDFIKGYSPINPLINVNELVKSFNFHIMLDEDKDIYFGNMVEGKKTGLGVFVNKSSKMEGKWENDEIISGYEISSQGFYKGKFKGNKRSGQGEFQWKNGESYDGEWKNGVRHGSGVWKSGKGDSYIGNWANGKVEGYGVHISASGQKYEGFFKNYLKHGKAKEIFPNGDMYEGNYREGKPNGKGKYTWKNKVIYEGEFVEGYRHGKGILKAPNSMKFEGDFTNERPNGNGDLTYENGDNYIGTFKDGEKDGFGTMKLALEHKVIVGKWKNNRFEE